ncbi:conserved hypothetical protein [Ricinus communis]|uniref:Uncharacterized protein n=1 Tax=Ricinus communis TaxID=3988 RepID=B9T898_RICCO|nr:conserved hypothetical protein [Ricinus communis]
MRRKEKMVKRKNKNKQRDSSSSPDECKGQRTETIQATDALVSLIPFLKNHFFIGD